MLYYTGDGFIPPSWQGGMTQKILGDIQLVWICDSCGIKNPGAIKSCTSCGEPYTIDTGTGIGQVVQDCIYRVYEDYCYYETMAWTTIDTLNTSGNDLDPYWPSADLCSMQRFGNRQESYQVHFEADGETYSLTTSELSLYQSAEPGSLWQLEVNQLGNVVSAQPVE